MTISLLESFNNTKLASTMGYCIALAGLGLSAAVIGPTLPVLAERTHSTLQSISLILVVRSAGYLVGSWLAGRWYDRRPGHPLVALGVTGMALGLALTPLLSELWLLAGVMTLIGLIEATIDVGANTLIVWVHGARVGPYLSGLHFAFGVGTFIAPLIVAWAVALGGGINWAYWTLALLALPGALWLVRLPSPVSPVVAQDSPQRQANVWLVAVLVLFFFLYTGGELGFGDWVYTYATSLGLANEIEGAYLTSAFWGAFTVGRLLSIPIAVRFNPRAVLTADIAGSVLSLALILIGRESAPLLWIGTLGLGVSMASVFPTLLSFAERRLHLSGQITGWFFVGASAGVMFWPWLVGQVIEPLGAIPAMLVIGAAIALQAVVLTVLLVSTRTAISERSTPGNGYSR